MRMQDGFDIGNLGGCLKHGSQFEFTFRSNRVIVGTLVEDPPIDQLFFLGVILPQTVNAVEIREIGTTVNGSTFCENDFFGVMFTAP